MLEEKEDSFGYALYDFYRGKGDSLIIERDDGYFDVTSLDSYFEDFEKWSENHKEAMYYVEGRVLDIGCGAGRHCLYLQKNGFKVVGIDNSPLAIKVSKLRGVKSAEIMDLHNIEFKKEEFGTILLLGNNFTLVGNPLAAKQIMNKFNSITAANGRVIAECLDPYQTDNEYHLKDHEFNRKRGRMGGQFSLRTRYRTHVSPWFDFLLLSKEEMGEIIKGTGWKITNFIESSQSPHYIAVIEKEILT